MFRLVRNCIPFALIALLSGCNEPLAPSVNTNGPIAVTWDHLSSEQWQYELVSDTTITDYGFNPAGRVTCHIGSHNVVDPVYGNEPMDSMYGIVCEWRILDNGDLLLLDDSDGVANTTLRLSALTQDSATVLAVASARTLQFTRRFKSP